MIAATTTIAVVACKIFVIHISFNKEDDHLFLYAQASQLHPYLPEIVFLYDELVQIVQDTEVITDTGIQPNRIW